ncbi:MAG: TIGR03619 family F420-dependent LLM class oxidoreductase [Pseudonocardiaceae bacterium]
MTREEHRTMRHGLALPQFGQHAKPAAITSFVRCAEDLGYRSFWVSDRILTPVDPSDLFPVGGTPEHPYPDEYKTFLDPIVTLAAAATVASHSRLGMSVLNAPWYNPVLLARSLTSLDNLAGGRFDCGFGIGWLRDEYTATNVSWGDRGARLDEILDVLTTIWTENPAEHHGTHYVLPRSHVDLRPLSPGGPPVLLGGLAPKAMERVGRRAAGWLPVHGIPPEVLDQLWQSARRAADGAGRDPASLRRELRVNVTPGTTIDDLAAVADTAEQTGMDGVFFDLHFATASPEEALETAAQLASKIGIS